jgi:hypothetical protein
LSAAIASLGRRTDPISCDAAAKRPPSGRAYHKRSIVGSENIEMTSNGNQRDDVISSRGDQGSNDEPTPTTLPKSKQLSKPTNGAQYALNSRKDLSEWFGAEKVGEPLQMVR